MMVYFFNDADSTRLTERTRVLMQRMIKLRVAVDNDRISREQLRQVAVLTTADVQEKSEAFNSNTLDLQVPVNDAFQQLQHIWVDKTPVLMTELAPFIEGLKQFDEAHGDYLSLVTLAVENNETLTLALNDVAIVYEQYIQYLTCQKIPGELDDQYAVSFNLSAAKLAWLQWKKTRPSRFILRQDSFPGLLEKFLAGQLKQNEWLTDLDIQRGLKTLGLTEKGAHVVPFKVSDLGLALHFEREKHRLDDPKIRYTIPLIVNLGEDGHSRIDSRGNHWTRLLVTVDPREPIPKITVKYTDELNLPNASKKQMTETITAALKYYERQGDITSSNSTTYSAFPECEEPVINVIGSGEQRDSFTCGYRALRGVIADLLECGDLTLADNPWYERFMACHDSTSFRNLGYRLLIGQQGLTVDEQAEITRQSAWRDTSFEQGTHEKPLLIKPSLIEGKLLEFAQTSTKTIKNQSKALTADELEKLVEADKMRSSLEQSTVVKSYSDSIEAKVSLNMQDFLRNPEIQAFSNDTLAVQAIFAAIRSNPTITNITLTGIDSLEPTYQKLIYQQLDCLSCQVDVTTSEASSDLALHLSVIQARNELLTALGEEPNKDMSDPWGRLFELMLFTPSGKPRGGVFDFDIASPDSSNVTIISSFSKIGTVAFAKLLEYMADHEDRFSDDQFFCQVLNVTGLISMSGKFDGLQKLKAHLQSSSPFVAFKHLILAVDFKDDVVNELAATLDLLQNSNIEHLEFKQLISSSLSIENLDALIKIVQEKQVKVLLTFSTDKKTDPMFVKKLAELQNAVLANRRVTPVLSPLEPDSTPKAEIKPGKISNAILGRGGLGALDTEVQVQQQQQQQVQQQVQTVIDNDELPDEDEIQEESFSSYASREDLLDCDQFIKQMGPLIENRHPHLSAAQCWDLITGKDANYFKYGIQKMTVLAAKILIDNLQDVQYGLNPDNLPRGFLLQQDDEGKVVLTYTSFNPIINPKESPLTIRFSQPMPEKAWAGDVLQFMTEQKARELYQHLFSKKQTTNPSFEACCSQWFFIKDPAQTIFSGRMRCQILQEFIKGLSQGGEDQAFKINQQIKLLFGDDPDATIIAALSDILYEQNSDILSDFLFSLQQIKTIRGEAFFNDFKCVFIKPSTNLNELTTEASRAAIQKILAFSSAQATWWQSLTRQHSSNLKYAGGSSSGEEENEDISGFFAVSKTPEPGQRWSNLAELTEAFVYFCGQLDEVHPGLALTEYCPLSDVADMRVGLDRLVSTILPHAHDINEQFYESMSGLSLDPLGPFYASRYEGYKLVRSDMMLVLGAISSDLEIEKGALVEQGYCFRINKQNMTNSLAISDTHEKKKAGYLRYLATFNHRASVKTYSDVFNTLTKKIGAGSLDMGLLIVAIFGTGQRGKNFTSEDIDALVDFVNDGVRSRGIITAWQPLRTCSIKPTIAEVVAISQLALKSTSNEPYKRINEILSFVTSFADAADSYIDTLSLLAQNNSGISFDTLHRMLMQTEGINAQESHGDESRFVAEFGFEGARNANSLRAATARLFAVCSSHNINDDNAVQKAQDLYQTVTNCFKKHGEKTTFDLLELLGHIDVSSSELPTLDHLIEIVALLTSETILDYNTLEAEIKRRLPEQCRIQTSQVTVAPVDGGSLQTTITKYMREIRDELHSNQAALDQVLGKGFYDSLATQEGPAVLLSHLKTIAENSSFINGVIQDKIKSVMTKVYDTVLSDGMCRVGANSEQNNNLLRKIIMNKLNHPVKKEGDFKRFALIYPGQINAIDQLFAHLKKINQAWPNSLGHLLHILDDAPLGFYSIELLVKITAVFTTQFDPTKPFPETTFQAFFKFNALNDATQASLNGVVAVLFDEEDEAKQVPRTDRETQLLWELALRYCQTYSDRAVDFTKDLLNLRKDQPQWFARKLQRLSTCANLDTGLNDVKSAFESLSKLDEKLGTMILDFFEGERADEFLHLMKDPEIKTIVQDEHASGVLMIAFKAAERAITNKKPSTLNDLKGVITSLHGLEEAQQRALSSLYQAPRHPDLTQLKTTLESTSLDLNELAASYDRDPSKKRQDSAFFSAQFETDSLAGYLDSLGDLNYNRPLLLSQREELQQWFLYVNAIGHDKPILTRPFELDTTELKPISSMSHGEIQALLHYYRELFNHSQTTQKQRIKAQLECIALLREVMYRGTDKFPRPTQILYLLTAMQQGDDFIAQVQTGEGKSLTAALAAAMAALQGRTVDLCTSSSFLAGEGLHENQGFFDYLGLRAQLIHAGSPRADYQEGAIHYSTMSDMALYRSKRQLEGQTFPANCALIADEVDFLTLDDSTRYRFAMSLDPGSDPYKSPYIWIYEALVQFVDAKKAQNTVMSDADLLSEAQTWLKNGAKTKEQKTQLRSLEGTQAIYQKRLETWLLAAAKTAQLIEQEETKFRVVQLEHPEYGRVAKACILSGGRPNLQAEFSHAIQQFLHVRLRHKYHDDIESKACPNFLVEPEKITVTTLNSKIMMDTYKVRLGMSGTVGSSEEIKEQYAKYGFRFVDIPPFKASNRRDLHPILTNSKYLNDPAREEDDHLRKIVKETLRHVRQQRRGQCSPVLIHCADKVQGEKIAQALQNAIRANPRQYESKLNRDGGVQQYYSSEKPTVQERHDEENAFKNKASQDGMITISTVFDRGTDITPTHERGLYTIQTSVDTEPYSAEDLERSKRQKIGRAGRQGQVGSTRLIVCRSQFADSYSPKQLRQIPETVEGLDQAIRDLNVVRNKTRVVDRKHRESLDDVKQIVFKEFNSWIQQVNQHAKEAPDVGQAMKSQLLQHWSLFLGHMDDYWSKLEHDGGTHDDQLNAIAAFACAEWAKLAPQLETELKTWAKRHGLEISASATMLKFDELVNAVLAKHPMLQRHYIKDTQLRRRVDPNTSADAAYCDVLTIENGTPPTCLSDKMTEAQNRVVKALLQRSKTYLSTSAHRNQLPTTLQMNNTQGAHAVEVQQIMRALLYLRYKAFRNGNYVAHAALAKQGRDVVKTILWSGNQALIDALAKAQKEHFVALTNHQGQFEAQKSRYLNLMMPEWQQSLPQETTAWKKDSFATWWKGEENTSAHEAMRAQAVKWLSDYQGKWWSVSRDRKEVARQLLQKLNSDTTRPQDILLHLTLARTQLLANDARHQRSMADGIEGRLYQFLNDLETRVVAATDAATLDDDVQRKFSDIHVVLERFKSLPRFKALKPAFQKVIDAISDQNQSIDTKYQVISAFFKNIALMMQGDEQFQHDDWCSLYTYCQQQDMQLVNYFAQSDQLSKINQKGSVQVYRAACAAVLNVIKHTRATEPRRAQLNLPCDKMRYRDGDVSFVNSLKGEQDYLFFRQFNTTTRYTQLLSTIEQSIVERSFDPAIEVSFDKVTLNQSERFKSGFSLTVDMRITGKPTQIRYDIDSKTGMVYCDNASLAGLDIVQAEPSLGSDGLLNKIQDLGAQYTVLEQQSDALQKETELVIEQADQESAKQTSYTK